MNRAGKGTHQWRALKHFWKLILTPANELKYDNYWCRANFGYAQLTDVEVIHRLLSFDENLQQAYRYYQDLIFAVSQRSRSRLNQLLTIKLTVLPQSLQKVQRTLRQHKKEILHSFLSMKLILTVPLRALTIRSRSSNGFPMDSETLPISESGYCLRFLTLISPLTGRISKQPVPKSRHELLNKTYSIFSSVLLDEEP